MKRAAASTFGRPAYLGPPPVGALRLDAGLRTAREVVISMSRVHIGGAPQQDAMSAAARDHEPFATRGEAKSKAFDAETVGAWRSIEGALAWVD
jgi:hypothetical protein